MQTSKVIGLADAMSALDAVLAEAGAKPGRPIAAVVLDHHGDMVAFFCEAGANPALARQNAFKKAYTSACQRVDSGTFGERRRAQPDSAREFPHVNFTETEGGLVIIANDGTILGGLGVSGRPSGPEDMELAQAGLRALEALGL